MTTERIDIVVREDGSRVVRRNLADIGNTAGSTASTIDRLKNTLSSFGSVIAAAGIGLGIRELIRYTDEWNNLNSKLRLVTTSQEQFNRRQEELFSMSQRTRTALIETVALYSTIKKATESLNTTDTQRLRVTETINKAIIVSGTAATSAKAALVQLGQGLGSGTLRGEELNSVLEQAPRLAQALADGLGKSIGQLRALGAAGKLTSEAVFGALANQSQTIDEEFAQMATTVGQSLVVAENALTRFVGESNNANGSARGLAQSIIFLSQHLNEIFGVLTGLLVMKAAEFFIGISIAVYRKVAALSASIAAVQAERLATLAAAQAEVVRTQSILANIAATQAAVVIAREEQVARLALNNSILAATTAAIANTDATIVQSRAAIAAAQAAGAQSFALRTLALATRELNVAEAMRVGLQADLAIAERARAASLAQLAILGQQQTRITAANTAAQVAATAATAGLAGAQAAAAGGMGLATRALGLLGGPIGIITTLLGIGVTAWALWGNRAEKEETKVAETLESKTKEIIGDLDKQITKLKERNALAAIDPALGKPATPAAQQQNDIMTKINAIGSGKDVNGVANEYANLDSVAKTALLATLGGQYNQLSVKIAASAEQQKIFDKSLQGDKLKEFMKEFATVGEQRKAEIDKWKLALGDLFTPDVEKRISDSFKDATAKMDYKSALQALENKQAQEKEIMQQGLASADSLRKQGLLSESKYAEMQLDVQLTELANIKSFTQKQLELASGDDQKAQRQKYIGELELLELKRVGLVKGASNAIDAIKSAEADKERDRSAAAIYAIEQQTAQNDERIQNYGLLPDAITSAAIAQAEETKAILESIPGSKQAIADIEGRIVALNKLRDSQRTGQQQKLFDFDAKNEAAQWQSLGRIIGDSLASGFGRAGKSIATFTDSFTRMKADQADIAKSSAERIKQLAGNEVAQEKEKQTAARETEIVRVGGYANMLGAAKDYFGQNTVAYKVLGVAEKAYRIQELALALQNFAIKTGLLGSWLAIDTTVKTTATATDTAFTGASVVKSGIRATADGIAAFAKTLASIPFPFNIAAGAAVIGLLAAVGVKIAGGGGGGGGASAATVQKSQGTGSVFGDETAKSDSINKSLELLKDNSDIMLPLTQGMLASLRNIENSIKGVANLVLRSGGVTDGTNLVTTSGSAPGQATDFVSKFMTELSKGLLGPVVGGKLAEFGNKLWGSVKQNVVDAGIQFGGSVGQLQAGQGFNQYASVDTTKKSWFGLSKKTTNTVVTDNLSDELTQQLALIFKNLETTLKLAAPALGKDAEAVGAAIRAVVIDQTKVSLKDLKGEALTEALNAVISKAMDQIANAAFPQLDGFRQVGEGYTETVIRVASGIEQAKVALDKFNIPAVAYTDIINKQGDVATEIVRQSLNASDKLSSGLKAIVDVFDGTAGELVSLYGSLAAIQRQLNNVGLNGKNLGVTTIGGAGGVDELKTGLEDYFEKFFSETEQKAAALKDLTTTFKDMGLALPATKDAFRELVKSYDDGTASGNKMVGQLLALSGAYAEATEQTKAQQAIVDQRADLQDELNQMTMSSIQLRQLERNEIEKANVALFDQITAMRNVNSLLDRVTAAVNRDKQALAEQREAQVKATDAQIDSITKILDANKELKSSLDSVLNVNVVGGDTANRKAAQAQIEAALAITKASGKLPTADSLKDALGAVAKTSTAGFASSAEYRLDYYKTRNTVSQLSNMAGGQIDVQQSILNNLNEKKELDQEAYEQELKALDKIAEQAQTQVDLLTGIKAGSESSLVALANLLAAISGLNLGAKPGESTPGLGEAISPDQYGSAVEKLYKDVLGRDSDAGGKEFWINALKSGVSYADVTQGFYNSDEYKHINKVPGFAGGGDHSGGLRVVGENGWELEATGASKIWNQTQLAEAMGAGGDNTALEHRMDLMLVEFEKVTELMSRVAVATEGADETLDNATKGRPFRTKAT